MALAVPVNPSAGANTTAAGPIAAGKIGVLSQVIVANAGASEAKVRVAISATASPTAAEYVAYDVVCPPTDVISIPCADYVDAGFYIVVRASTGNCSFRLCGYLKDS